MLWGFLPEYYHPWTVKEYFFQYLITEDTKVQDYLETLHGGNREYWVISRRFGWDDR